MISLAELKTYLKITDVSQDDQLNQAIDLAKGFVASYVWYSLVLNTTTVAEFCWETNQFYLKRKGINSVSLIEYYEDEFNPAYISYNVTTDRREFLDLWLIKTRDYIWPFVKITYSFGYTDWTCPQDLKTANLEIASSYYKRQWAIQTLIQVWNKSSFWAWASVTWHLKPLSLEDSTFDVAWISGSTYKFTVKWDTVLKQADKFVIGSETYVVKDYKQYKWITFNSTKFLLVTEVTTALNRWIKKVVFFLEWEAIPFTPIDKWFLRNSYKQKFWNLTWTLYNTRKYAIFLHEWTKYMKGNPFMKMKLIW